MLDLRARHQFMSFSFYTLGISVQSLKRRVFELYNFFFLSPDILCLSPVFSHCPRTVYQYYVKVRTLLIYQCLFTVLASFCVTGLVGLCLFVKSLRYGFYRFQFAQFGWTHMLILMIVSQAYVLVCNICEGLIWYEFGYTQCTSQILVYVYI